MTLVYVLIAIALHLLAGYPFGYHHQRPLTPEELEELRRRYP